MFSMDVNHEFNNLYIINNEQSDSDKEFFKRKINWRHQTCTTTTVATVVTTK